MSQRERLPLETSRTELSVAVALEDAFTERRSTGPAVRLRDRPDAFTRTPSGYAVLTDRSAADAPFDVIVDGDARYLPERFVIDAADLASPPVIEHIALRPSPAYPFPAYATLVRGTITAGASDETPVAGAEVSIAVEDATDAPAFRTAGRSDERGEYVLFVTGITADDVVGAYDGTGDDRLVHVDGAEPTVQAIHPETGATTSEAIAIAEGETTRLDLAF